MNSQLLFYEHIGGLAILATPLLFLGGPYLLAMPNRVTVELWEGAGLSIAGTEENSITNS